MEICKAVDYTKTLELACYRMEVVAAGLEEAGRMEAASYRPGSFDSREVAAGEEEGAGSSAGCMEVGLLGNFGSKVGAAAEEEAGLVQNKEEVLHAG